MNKNISKTIVEVCKDIGIQYKSINPNYTVFYEDSKKLADIYNQLKAIEDKLIFICDRHKIEGIENIFKDDLELIEKVNHDLIKVAKKFIEDEKKNIK